MKVALIHPAAKGNRYSVEPMGLGYIASCLEQNNIGVKIIDQVAGDDVRREINSYRPDIVGVTSRAHIVVEAYQIADMCRRMKIPTILGGMHPTAMPEEALGHADIVVVGEGERIMLDILQKGITSGIVSAPHIENLDELPFPHWRLMKQEFYMGATGLKRHMLNSLGHKFSSSVKSASVLSSRGCPFRCIFCRNSLRQSPVRFHSAGRVLEEVRRLKKDYGAQIITFLDENLLVDKERLEEICRGFIDEKLDIAWCAGASAHFIDAKTTQMIRDAGCKMVAFGIESGSQKILDVLGKSTLVRQNQEAIATCKQAGLMVHASFMLGSPQETLKDVTLTQDFIRRTQPDVFYVNITTPYPGTKLWEDYQEKIRRPINWRRFNSSDSLEVYPFTPFRKLRLGQLFLETVLVRPIIDRQNSKETLHYLKQGLCWFLNHPLITLYYFWKKYLHKDKPD